MNLIIAGLLIFGLGAVVGYGYLYLHEFIHVCPIEGFRHVITVTDGGRTVKVAVFKVKEEEGEHS